MQASISGLPSSMLTGEVTRLGVEVFNVGQVALNSLRLASSLGSQLLLDKVSDTANKAVLGTLNELGQHQERCASFGVHSLFRCPQNSIIPSTLPLFFLLSTSLLVPLLPFSPLPSHLEPSPHAVWNCHSPRDGWNLVKGSEPVSSCKGLPLHQSVQESERSH